MKLRVGLIQGLNPQWWSILTTTATAISMHDIRAITLDLDDTLWEIHPVIRRAEQTLYQWLADNYPRITEKFTPDDMREVRAQVVLEFADMSHDLTFMRRMVLSRISSAAGYSDDFIDEAFAVFDKARNAVELFPEVIPALESLQTDFRLIAVTNGNASLEKIGIDHLFDDFVTAASAGAAKPAQQIFDVAVSAGGATPSTTLHVGDHPHYDVDGARAAGLRTAWINRSSEVWPTELTRPEVEVIHIGDLARILLDARK